MSSPTTPVRLLASSQQMTPPLTPAGSFDNKDLKDAETTPPPQTPPDLSPAHKPILRINGTALTARSAPVPDIRTLAALLAQKPARRRRRSFTSLSPGARSPVPESDSETEEDDSSDEALTDGDGDETAGGTATGATDSPQTGPVSEPIPFVSISPVAETTVIVRVDHAADPEEIRQKMSEFGDIKDFDVYEGEPQTFSVVYTDSYSAACATRNLNSSPDTGMNVQLRYFTPAFTSTDTARAPRLAPVDDFSTGASGFNPHSSLRLGPIPPFNSQQSIEPAIYHNPPSPLPPTWNGYFQYNYPSYLAPYYQQPPSPYYGPHGRFYPEPNEYVQPTTIQGLGLPLPIPQTFLSVSPIPSTQHSPASSNLTLTSTPTRPRPREQLHRHSRHKGGARSDPELTERDRGRTVPAEVRGHQDPLPDVKPENQFYIERIRAGLEVRKSVMIKNIPNRMTEEDFLKVIHDTVGYRIDFSYLRIDFKSGCNVGYAFVNFINTEDLLRFAENKLGVPWGMYQSTKVLKMCFADYQGKEALVEKFRNSCILDQKDGWRPRIFYSDGPNVGLPEPFPSPNHQGRRQRSAQNMHNFHGGMKGQQGRVSHLPRGYF